MDQIIPKMDQKGQKQCFVCKKKLFFAEQRLSEEIILNEGSLGGSPIQFLLPWCVKIGSIRVPKTRLQFLAMCDIQCRYWSRDRNRDHFGHENGLETGLVTQGSVTFWSKNGFETSSRPFWSRKRSRDPVSSLIGYGVTNLCQIFIPR